MKPFVRAVGGKNHTVIYTDADGRHFRFSGGTWTWRNHNPGNLYADTVSKRHDQIGKTHHFAIFPNDQCGHDALLDSLHTTYGNKTLHHMIYKFAPPKDNPTKKYEKFLREKTGVYDDRLIKNFTPIQFKKLWEAIQQFEGHKAGKITEIFRVTSVETMRKNLYQFYLDEQNWISESKCISMAKKGELELEVCSSDLGNTFLRSPPNSLFQKPLHLLIKK